MAETRYVNQECTAATFRPCALHSVRWLDREQDFELARAIWFQPITIDDWRGFYQQGYTYCAVVDAGHILSMAAVWSYSENAWEVAAVHTVPHERQKGYGKSVVSFVTAHILEAGRLATCLTEAANLPMQRTAASVGFYPAPRAQDV